MIIKIIEPKLTTLEILFQVILNLNVIFTGFIHPMFTARILH